MEVSCHLHTQPLDPWDRTVVHIEYKAGWTPELVWMFWRKEKPLALPAVQPQFIQPTASHWTDCANLAPLLNHDTAKYHSVHQCPHNS
jgi:hypothetical protein